MRIKKLTIITSVFIFLFGGIAYAANSTKPVQAYLSDIKLYLNGNRVDKEVIIVDGTSYLPVRAVSEALGLEVQWDGNNRTIYLSNDDTSKSKTWDVTGKWDYDGNKLILKQNGNFVTGSFIFYKDKSQWPIPVDGIIKGDHLSLKVIYDSRESTRYRFGVEDNNLTAFSIYQANVYDFIDLDISSNKLSGKFYYAKIWFDSDYEFKINKVANGDDDTNPIEPVDVTFTKVN